MKHSITVDGLCYRLRPVVVDDATMIVEVRLSDSERNKFVHPILPDPNEQVKWIKNYYTCESDYYFVIENRLTSNAEGLIGIYNIKNGMGEWGRWVIKPGSFAAIESVNLLYKVAFNELGMSEIYCRTITENESVVSFHDAIGEKRRHILRGYFEMNAILYDVVEHYSDKEYYEYAIQPKLEEMSFKIFNHCLKRLLGKFEFHHVAVAVKDISREFSIFQMLGYQKVGDVFTDLQQGISGLFIEASDQPRIELLSNYKNSSTLDGFLASGTKMYHFAYIVSNFDTALKVFKKLRAKIISSPKESVYFGKRIAFLVLPNMFIIELIEC
jgi:RimJ/RimL family protein N-acetyltransferase